LCKAASLARSSFEVPRKAASSDLSRKYPRQASTPAPALPPAAAATCSRTRFIWLGDSMTELARSDPGDCERKRGAGMECACEATEPVSEAVPVARALRSARPSGTAAGAGVALARLPASEVVPGAGVSARSAEPVAFSNNAARSDTAGKA